MRVKISYGTEISEVPNEVSDLFGFVYEKAVKVETQTKLIDDLLLHEDTQAALQLMNRMRETLAEMDGRLSDLALILDGYNNFIKNQGVQNELHNGRPAMDTAGDATVQGVEQPSSDQVQREAQSSDLQEGS